MQCTAPLQRSRQQVDLVPILVRMRKTDTEVLMSESEKASKELMFGSKIASMEYRGKIRCSNEVDGSKSRTRFKARAILCPAPQVPS